MIRIHRSECHRLLSPNSDKRKQAEKIVRDIVENGGRPKSNDFKPLWGKRPVRKTLHKMQNGRCCYCERFREVTRESDIEHFRPKGAIAEEPVDEAGYWWLAYDWNNLFFACRHCNQEYKKCRFPIRGHRAKQESDSLVNEDPFLIDPAKENPEDFFSFDWVTQPGEVIPNGRGDARERGDLTIEICGLDHYTLNKQRAGILKALRQLVLKMNYYLYLANTEGVSLVAEEIHDATSAGQPIEFLGFRRWFFRDAGLEEYIADD